MILCHADWQTAYGLKPFTSQHIETPHKTRHTSKGGPARLQTPPPPKIKMEKRERVKPSRLEF